MSSLIVFHWPSPHTLLTVPRLRQHRENIPRCSRSVFLWDYIWILPGLSSLIFPMHGIPLKRSVTAPHSSAPHPNAPVPSITVTANALGSFTPSDLSRHRSTSPCPQSRLHSPDSPRPSGFLSHKDVVLGRSRSRSPTPQPSASRTPGSTPSTSSIPIFSSDKSSNVLSRVYASEDSSLKSSVLLSSNTPSIIVSEAEQLLEVPLPGYHSNTSSQSNLSAYAPNEYPGIFSMSRPVSGNSGVTPVTLGDDLNPQSSEKGNKISRSVRRKFPGYVAAEVQRISRSDPGANTPHFQFPIWRESAAPDLSIRPEDFKRKLVIGDPDPSFHRSLNSPVEGYSDQVVLEQVGSFRVHHLRNDSLGELPRISTVEELPPSPSQLSSGAHSPRKGSHLSSSSGISLNTGSPPSRSEINPLELSAVSSASEASSEITTNTVFLPGEHGRRQHSRAGARSHGNRNIGVPLHISTQAEPQSKAIAGVRVTPEGPPATPESPFTSVSREQTRLKGSTQNSPSPMITFLPAKVSNQRRKPLPPGKGNPDWILPIQPLRATVAACFAHAYGDILRVLQPGLYPAPVRQPDSLGSMVIDNENLLSVTPSHLVSGHIHSSLGSLIADNRDLVVALPPNLIRDMNIGSPSLQRMYRIIGRDGKRSPPSP